MSAEPRHLPVLDDAEALEIQRPRTRGDCLAGGCNAARPCPWVSCEHHAIHGALGVQGRVLDDDGAVAAIETMAASCTLDVADRRREGDPSDATLETVSEPWGVSKERVRQIEAKALKAIKRAARPLREHIVEEPSPELRPARAGAARPVEDRRRTEAPTQHAGLATPETVTEAAQGMWCPWMGAAMTGGLCARRHAARTGGTAMTAGRPGHSWPTYPGCASCADGAAVAARLGAVGSLVPVREVVAARAIDWMGDGEAAPANDTEDTMATKAQRKEAPRPARVETTGGAAGCAFGGCREERGGVRSDTRPEFAPYCARHREALRSAEKGAGGDFALGLRRLEAVARAGLDPQNARGIHALYEREGLLAARVEAPAPQDSAELALVRRDRDDARARLADAAAREADLRTEVASLRAELAAARAVAPSTTSPWARLDRLAAVLRPGQTIAWSVSSGDPWAASAHALDGAGTVDAWTGEGATPDEAIAALVAAVEGEATARVEAIRAAMEGRS